MSLADFANFMTVVGLMAMMLSMGLKVTFAEVLNATRQPRLIVLSLVANFLLVPAVTLGLLYLFDANPMVSVGFLILAICPGAPVGPPIAAIAKGDVPSSIGQMVILSGLSALLSPALLSLLMAQLLPVNDLHIDYLAIVRTLLVAQILPLLAGLGLHHGWPKISERLAKPVGLLANLLLLVVTVILLARQFDTLQSIQLRGWFGMLLLLASSLGIGWLCGGPGLATRKSLSLTTAVRNVAVALVIVANNFAGTPAVTAVVAYAIVSIFGSLGCAYLFGMMPMRQPHGTVLSLPAEKTT